MAEISDGFIKITMTAAGKKGLRKVTLDTGQFSLPMLSQYRLFLNASHRYLAGKVVSANEDQLVLEYQLPSGATPLPVYLKNRTRLDKLRLISQLYWLVEAQNDGQQPFISPDNLYVIGEHIVAMHRGFMQHFAPSQESEEQRVKQFKALILYVLNPKTDYAKTVVGAAALNNKFAKDMAKLTAIDQIEDLVNHQLAIQEKIARKTEITIKKSRYQATRWTAIIASIAAVVLLLLAVFWNTYTLPKQRHVISAQSDYMNANYTRVADDLQHYKPRSLPQSARFVLAVSYINLDDLSKTQKQAVMKNISQKSNPTQLNYWIELGRGHYQNALSIAKNIGDDEYILHAYTKLYTSTKNNTTMDGAKKQKQLNSYRKQINKYIKKLGGAKNEFESN